MVIGFCRVVIHLPQASSLKGKRGILKGLLEKLRRRFNISIAEIGFLDNWKRAELGITAISNEKEYLYRLFDQIIKVLDHWKELDLMDYSTEYF